MAWKLFIMMTENYISSIFLNLYSDRNSLMMACQRPKLVASIVTFFFFTDKSSSIGLFALTEDDLL